MRTKAGPHREPIIPLGTQRMAALLRTDAGTSCPAYDVLRHLTDTRPRTRDAETTGRKPIETTLENVVNTQTNRRRLLAFAAITIGATALSTGCSSERNRLAEYRDDPTPNLVTMDKRSDDIANRTTLIKDEGRRMLVRDWFYLWYLDRPTRLRPEPSSW